MASYCIMLRPLFTSNHAIYVCMSARSVRGIVAVVYRLQKLFITSAPNLMSLQLCWPIAMAVLL
jgi:hypothetical protein